MSSRKATLIVGMVVWSAVGITAGSKPSPVRHASAAAVAASTTESPREERQEALDCSRFRVRFDRGETVYGEEERTITRAEAELLRVEPEANSGVRVVGWDSDSYGVTLCKAVEAGSGAQDALSRMHLEFQGGELRTTHPEKVRNWGAQLIIRSPKNAHLEVHTQNGPLDLYEVTGTVKVQSMNGPVTLTKCSGNFEVESQNGPVTLQSNSGWQKVHSENGPLNLTLQAPVWIGQGLEARTQNGPVNVKIPSGYESSTVVESDGNSPFRCESSVCSQGRRTWDEAQKRIEFGKGPAVIRLTSANGPITVE